MRGQGCIKAAYLGSSVGMEDSLLGKEPVVMEEAKNSSMGQVRTSFTPQGSLTTGLQDAKMRRHRVKSLSSTVRSPKVSSKHDPTRSLMGQASTECR